MPPKKIKLDGIKETLLMPLWGRAEETKKRSPFFSDPIAVKIVEGIDYDFSKFYEKVHPLSRAAWIARSLYFDQKVKEFIEKWPDGSIINIGCGLDTTFERVNCHGGMWYDVDFPDVIE